MARDKKLQPVIVKRVKKAGHAHHGGAWKIAYADFVTAMMAFFLLMWLLSSTTDGDRKGIADYFNAPMRVAFTGGSSSGESTLIIKGGGQDPTRAVGQVKRGESDVAKAGVTLQQMKAEAARVERVRLELMKQELEKRVSESPSLAALGGQLRIDMTADGLRIQIVDEGKPMFASGSAVVQPYMRELLREIGTMLLQVPNRLTLEGHTDAQPYQGGDTGYSNWELSADRANASRRELRAAGIGEDRVLRVLGLAASQPLDQEDRKAAVNRRISIMVMTREAEERLARPPGTVTAQALAESAPPALPQTPAQPPALR